MSGDTSPLSQELAMMPPTGYETPVGEFEGYFCQYGLTDAYFAELKFAEIVHVAGSGPKKEKDEWFKNPFGHTLFCLGPNIGYVHSCEPGQHRCRYLPAEEWDRYCDAMGKPREAKRIIRVGDKISKPIIVGVFVNQVLMYGYDWKTKHDCTTMVDEILEAGGVSKEDRSNTVIPWIATQNDTLKEFLRGYKKV
jgi:hypothetical protein